MHLSKFEIFISLMSSAFVCSFSSVLSAAILISFTIGVMVKIYWMIVSVIPLYLFSLFMLGGLYVLIGFVMMSDIRDLDMIFSGSSGSDLVISFLILLSIIFMGKHFAADLSSIDWSVMKEESREIWLYFSSTYMFLMFFLFIYLYIMFVMTKGSWGGGGFIN